MYKYTNHLSQERSPGIMKVTLLPLNLNSINYFTLNDPRYVPEHRFVHNDSDPDIIGHNLESSTLLFTAPGIVNDRGAAMQLSMV